MKSHAIIHHKSLPDSAQNMRQKKTERVGLPGPKVRVQCTRTLCSTHTHTYMYTVHIYASVCATHNTHVRKANTNPPRTPPYYQFTHLVFETSSIMQT